MMILRSAPPSPFGRKVKIAASILDLDGDIKVEPTDTADPGDTIRRQNPLGKIPALIIEDGSVIYDSRVILEYLDMRAGGGHIIPAGDQRVPALVLQALCDGILDASILQVYEHRYRPAEIVHQPWLDYQAEKVSRALDALEHAPPAINGTPNVGHIALACALGYRDFRFDGRWRDTHPQLAAWLIEFSEQVPAYDATKPQ